MQDRREFYEQRARFRPRELQAAYHALLHRYYSFIVPAGARVLELGCGLGDLLAAVQLRRGVGVDFSPAMIELARARHPELDFRVAEAAEFCTPERFDYVILLEPYLSLTSHVVYGCFHPEPVAWRKPIESSTTPRSPQVYYAAQGNATRLFFGPPRPSWLDGWRRLHAEAFACFSYLLSGGYSRPALHPARWLPALQRVDVGLSRWPRLFGGRCLVALGLEQDNPSASEVSTNRSPTGG